MQPKRFQKKPVVIEAMQHDGSEESAHAIERWAGAKQVIVGMGEARGIVRIATPEGVMTANPGDWVIRGGKGEFYPCKPDIFEVTYEAVS